MPTKLHNAMFSMVAAFRDCQCYQHQDEESDRRQKLTPDLYYFCRYFGANSCSQSLLPNGRREVHRSCCFFPRKTSQHDTATSCTQRVMPFMAVFQQNSTSAFVSDQYFAVAGCHDEEMLSSVEVFNPLTSVWTQDSVELWSKKNTPGNWP